MLILVSCKRNDDKDDDNDNGDYRYVDDDDDDEYNFMYDLSTAVVTAENDDGSLTFLPLLSVASFRYFVAVR